jgi:hypothetical protein
MAGQANRPVTLTVSRTGTAGWARAAVYAPSGAFVTTVTATNQGQFTPQETGTYIVQVYATDLTSTATYNMGVNWTPCVADLAPAVTITNPTAADSYVSIIAAVNLAGTVTDDGVVTQVTWSNDRGGSGTATGTTAWSIAGILLQTGENRITVTARDNALNIGTDSILITYQPPNDPGGALRFVPVTPCRVVDTRNPAGPLGGPSLAANQTRVFPIPSSTCGVPAEAQAYSLNVTVVPYGFLGYLTVWPAGQPMPVVSLLNSWDGRVKANAAITPAGASGAISVFATNATDVVLDINGYFVPAANPAGLSFYSLTPCRVVDTRNPVGPLGGPAFAAGQTRTFPITASACGIPASARAYSLNFTAVPTRPLGYLSTAPSGSPMPIVSTLNSWNAQVVANAAIVPAGTAGGIDVIVTDPAHVVIDINGYFAPPGVSGLSLYNLTPCRLFDTRATPPPVNGQRTVPIAGLCGAPPAARAFALNGTVVPNGPLGYLTLWPAGQTQPVVSTLNSWDGSVVSNMAIVPTSNGSINGFASNPTELILDISAYFAP